MADHQPRTPSWQIISRFFGLFIVISVLVGWFRGQSISEPGVLMLLAIATALLGLDVAAVLRRNGRNGSR